MTSKEKTGTRGIHENPFVPVFTSIIFLRVNYSNAIRGKWLLCLSKGKENL